MRYWDRSAEHYDLVDEARSKLVPIMGDAPTTLGQMVRAFSNINYDIFNNGGGNLYEANLVGGPFWDDSEEEEYENELKELTEDHLYALKMFIDRRLVKKLEEEILNIHECDITSIEPVIDEVGDAVAQVLIERQKEWKWR